MKEATYSPATTLLFGEEPLEGILLFSVEGKTATEVTFRGIEFATDATPLFDNSTVTKPVPIMVEGTYAVLNPATKQYQNINITADDIEHYFHNTPRDVAVNYEHRRGGTAKGWVRLKDTGRVGTLKTSTGEKLALFASLELFEQAASDVRAGYFRDVSIELKPISKEIIGTALTATPVMRDLQFYSNTPTLEEPETPDPIQASSDSPAAEPEQTPETPAAIDDIPQEDDMSQIDKQQLFAEMLGEHGLTVEDLQALPELLNSAKEAKRNAQLIQARDTIKEFATREDGAVVLAPAGIEVGAQLLVFAQDNAELQFSVEGENKTPVELLEALFSHIEAVQIFGESAGVSASDIEGTPPAPANTEDTEVMDEGRVNSIVERMKASRKFNSQAQA